MAPTCKCFVDVGHCQVPLLIESGNVARAKTADPRRTTYPNLAEKLCLLIFFLSNLL